MALSPADFAAYSRATGTPYPEDPEERAQLAPEVAQFRHDQLRAPRQESALSGILGAAAVGLGALTGGMALARALGGKRGQAAASTAFNLPKKEEQALRTVSAAPMRQQVAEDVVRQARTERPTGTVLTDLVNYRFQQGLADIPEPTKQEFANITKSQFDRLYDESTKLPLPRTTTDPGTGRSVILDPFGIDPSSRQAVYASVAAKPESQLPRVYKPQSNIEVALITDPNTGEIFRRGKSPETFARDYISLRPALTGQKTDLPLARTPGSFKEFSRDVSGVSVAKQEPNVGERLRNVGFAMQGAPVELAGEGIGVYSEKYGGKNLPLSSPLAQKALQEAGVTEQEAINYWTNKNKEFFAQVAQDIATPESATFLETLVGQQSQTSPLIADQSINALGSSEDQMTGRTMRSVQRNEDLDSSQVNEVLRQTGSADVAASLTPDGIPVDQTEGVGYDLRTGEKFTFGGSRPSRTGLAPGGTIELETASGSDLGQSSAARFLQKRRLELLGDPEAGTSTRLENKLAEAFGPEAWREDPKATRRRNALKLGAAGNEQFFENINEGTFTVGGEQFPVSLLKEGVYMEDTAQALADRVDKYKNWLGNIRLEETNKQIRLGAELENLNAQDAGLMNNIYQLQAALEDRPASFKTPQERDRYMQLKRDMQGALERQDELDIQMNQALREFELSERRLAGAQAATLRNIQKAAVPQKLMSGVEEGIVVRPVLTAPDNIVLEEGELSNLERGRPVGEFISQEQLEVVPGGLLSGGRAKSLVNIGGDLGIDPDTGERILLPNVDVNTGETLVQKLAGKRIGEDVSVRGRGGVAGLDTMASIGIYGPELAEYGTAAMTKEGTYTPEAMRPPTATETSVPVHKIRTYKKGEEGEDIPVYFNYPSSYEDPQAYKYTQQLTPEELENQKQSLILAERARRGELNLPRQSLGPYPSSILARPVRINTPQEQVIKPPLQMAFPSDVIPERGGRVRQSPADVAANQLEAYMSKLQRGRSTPLTSQAVIQPRLF